MVEPHTWATYGTQLVPVELAGVPGYILRPTGTYGPYPTIILYHCWGSEASRQVFRGQMFAQQGYQVAMFDAPEHGRRGIGNDNPDIVDPHVFWRVVLQSIEETNRLLDVLVRDYQADGDRIGLWGHSLGAFSATGLFARNLRIRAIAVLNGVFDWRHMVELMGDLHGEEKSYLTDGPPLSSVNPAEHTIGLIDRPILMLNGKSDTRIDYREQRAFYYKMRLLYQNQDMISYKGYEDLSHYVTDGMLLRSLMFFDRYLANKERRG